MTTFKQKQQDRNRRCGFEDKAGIIGNYWVNVERKPDNKKKRAYQKLVTASKANTLVNGKIVMSPAGRPHKVMLSRDFRVV